MERYKEYLTEATNTNKQVNIASTYIKGKFFGYQKDITKEMIADWITKTKIDLETLLLNLHYRSKQNLERSILSGRKSSKLNKAVPIPKIEPKKMNSKYMAMIKKLVAQNMSWAKSNLNQLDGGNFSGISIDSIAEQYLHSKERQIASLYNYKWYRSHATDNYYGDKMPMDIPEKEEWEQITGEKLTSTDDRGYLIIDVDENGYMKAIKNH